MMPKRHARCQAKTEISSNMAKEAKTNTGWKHKTHSLPLSPFSDRFIFFFCALPASRLSLQKTSMFCRSLSEKDKNITTEEQIFRKHPVEHRRQEEESSLVCLLVRLSSFHRMYWMRNDSRWLSHDPNVRSSYCCFFFFFFFVKRSEKNTRKKRFVCTCVWWNSRRMPPKGRHNEGEMCCEALFGSI